MNGTYAAWPAGHDGCYATTDIAGVCRARMSGACGPVDTAWDGSCWVNSPEFAWFEGFPTYFARSVAAWDVGLGASSALTLIPRSVFAPSTCACPLVATAHYNRDNHLITPAAVEDYVWGALRALALRT